MGRWYGSLQNRLAENRQLVDTIEVGMGVTEYYWSDRVGYEIIAVKDQRHFTMRLLDHKLKGEAYTNDWELTSNESNPTYDLVKRGKYWYTVGKWTDENGKTHREYHRKNITIGYADYYYDWGF